MPTYDLVSYIATLFGLVVILSLVALKSVSNRVYQSFLLFGGVVGLYVTASFISQFHHTYSWGILWTRLALLIANFIPTAFYLFAKYFTNYKTKSLLINYAIYFIPILLGIVAFSKYTISAIDYTSYGVTLSGTGPGLFGTLIYFIGVFSFCFWIFHNHLKDSIQSTRSQVKLITYSTGAVVTINLITQIALPEIHLTDYGNRIGIPSIVLFVGAVGYAILRQKLFDIRSAVIRSLIFTITLFMTGVVFAIVMLFPTKVLFPGLFLTHSEEIYFIIAGVTLAFIFRPLTTLMQELTDRLFYQDHYDSAVVVSEVGQVIASEILLNSLCQKVRAVLSQSMHIYEIDIIVLDKGGVFYEAGNYFSSVHDRLVLELETLGDQLLVADELYVNKKKEILQKYGINVFEVLRTKNEKVGYLLFSDKLNGTAYNITDTNVINTVSDELAIAIQNSRAYTQIQKFNDSLQKRVENATQQLRAANQKLTQQDAMKNDFISMVSHQLGTPLSIIDGFLTLTLQGFYGKVEGHMRETLEKALSRNRMLERLTVDLLNISRMTAGKFFLELSEADMNKIVAEEVDELERQAKDKEVKLTYHRSTKPIPKITIDEPKTRQAVMNVINNAIFYAPGGKVDVYLDSDGQNIIFKVIDNGIGVPEDQKPMLFTKFFRADNARKESPQGTGIGLYLVKRIVGDQHGQIIFQSTVEKGSTFGFTLPIVSPEQKPQPSQPTESPAEKIAIS